MAQLERKNRQLSDKVRKMNDDAANAQLYKERELGLQETLKRKEQALAEALKGVQERDAMVSERKQWQTLFKSLLSSSESKIDFSVSSIMEKLSHLQRQVKLLTSAKGRANEVKIVLECKHI